MRNYADGVFDLASRRKGVELVIGLLTDDVVESYKRRPVISFENRFACINECRVIYDEVIPTS